MGLESDEMLQYMVHRDSVITGTTSENGSRTSANNGSNGAGDARGDERQRRPDETESDIHVPLGSAGQRAPSEFGLPSQLIGTDTTRGSEFDKNDTNIVKGTDTTRGSEFDKSIVALLARVQGTYTHTHAQHVCVYVVCVCLCVCVCLSVCVCVCADDGRAFASFLVTSSHPSASLSFSVSLNCLHRSVQSSSP